LTADSLDDDDDDDDGCLAAVRTWLLPWGTNATTAVGASTRRDDVTTMNLEAMIVGFFFYYRVVGLVCCLASEK
jgi:hypothetical protein